MEMCDFITRRKQTDSLHLGFCVVTFQARGAISLVNTEVLTVKYSLLILTAVIFNKKVTYDGIDVSISCFTLEIPGQTFYAKHLYFSKIARIFSLSAAVILIFADAPILWHISGENWSSVVFRQEMPVI